MAGLLGFAASTARAAEPAAGIGAADVSNVLMSLVLVVGFIFGAAFFIKRLPLGIAARGNGPLKIVATLALGPKERLLLVEARGAEVLVALGPGGVAIAHPGAEGARFGALAAGDTAFGGLLAAAGDAVGPGDTADTADDVAAPAGETIGVAPAALGAQAAASRARAAS